MKLHIASEAWSDLVLPTYVPKYQALQLCPLLTLADSKGLLVHLLEGFVQDLF